MWNHRPKSTLTEVMACCLTTPRHYPNQSWLIVNWAPRKNFQLNLNQNTKIICQEHAFESVLSKMFNISLKIKVWVKQFKQFNSLWPSDATWQHKFGSTLGQIMACCLMAPSHYLNQCLLIISEVQWQSPDGIWPEIPQPPITKISLKMTFLKFYSNLPGANKLVALNCM